jgi:hypothetical protein
MTLVIAMLATGGLEFVTAVLLVGTVELLFGAVLGWWLRGGAKSHRIAADDPVGKARFALSNLNDLTYRARSDVGTRSTYIGAIGNEVNSCQEEDGPVDDDFQQAVTRVPN